MNIEDAADGPAPSDLFHPTPAAVEEDRLPRAKKLERLAHVVVTAAVTQGGVVRVRLLIVRPRTGVHALRPCELSIRHELARELMLQFGEHSVVVSVAVHAPVVAATDLRIQGVPQGRRSSVRVLVEIDVTGQAPLIPQRRYELMPQIVLHIRRVVVDTHSGQSGGEDAHVNRAGCG